MRLPNDQPRKDSILDDHIVLCDTGSLLALTWLRTAAQVVERGDVVEADAARRAVLKALDEMLEHRGTCELCNEE